MGEKRRAECPTSDDQNKIARVDAFNSLSPSAAGPGGLNRLAAAAEIDRLDDITNAAEIGPSDDEQDDPSFRFNSGAGAAGAPRSTAPGTIPSTIANFRLPASHGMQRTSPAPFMPPELNEPGEMFNQLICSCYMPWYTNISHPYCLAIFCS